MKLLKAIKMMIKVILKIRWMRNMISFMNIIMRQFMSLMMKNNQMMIIKYYYKKRKLFLKKLKKLNKKMKQILLFKNLI